MTNRFVGPLCLTGEGQLVRVTPRNKSLQLPPIESFCEVGLHLGESFSVSSVVPAGRQLSSHRWPVINE